MFDQAFPLLHIFQYVVAPFLPKCRRCRLFSQQFMLHFCFQPFTPRDCARLSRFILNLSAFQFAPVVQRGLILSTPRVSSLQPPTAPLPVCLLVQQKIFCYISISFLFFSSRLIFPKRFSIKFTLSTTHLRLY